MMERHIERMLRRLPTLYEKEPLVTKINEQEYRILLTRKEAVLNDPTRYQRKDLLVNDPEYIIAMVEKHFDITIDMIKTKTRVREILVPRQVLCLLLRDYSRKYFKMKYSLRIIGEMISEPGCAMDHATVLHACNVVEDTWESDIIYGYGDIISELYRELDTYFTNKIKANSEN
jgi:chromosomal replication initiation ATPase DnaA